MAEKLEFQVDGMTCQGCVSSVTKALERMQGVERVMVSLEQKKAWVETSLPQEKIRAAIENLGFEASSVS